MTKKFKLTPFPITLIVSNDAAQFSTEKYQNDDGYANRCDTTIYIAINPSNDAQTQLDSCIHESMHAIQYMEHMLGNQLDDETAAYFLEHIAKLAQKVCGLKCTI